MTVAIEMPSGTRYGSRVVIGEAPSRGRVMVRVRCDCGRESVVSAQHLRAGRARACRSCNALAHAERQRRKAAAEGRPAARPVALPAVRQVTVEVVLLAAEHEEITAELIRDELGMDRPSQVAGRAAMRGYLGRHRQGVYRLAPGGLAMLLDIVEGRRPDRWRLAGEIRAALAARAERAA